MGGDGGEDRIECAPVPGPAVTHHGDNGVQRRLRREWIILEENKISSASDAPRARE